MLIEPVWLFISLLLLYAQLLQRNLAVVYISIKTVLQYWPQVTYNDGLEYKEAFQVIADLYLWQSVASIVGLYINAKRLSTNWQQIVMYGNKCKGNDDGGCDGLLDGWIDGMVVECVPIWNMYVSIMIHRSYNKAISDFFNIWSFSMCRTWNHSGR